MMVLPALKAIEPNLLISLPLFSSLLIARTAGNQIIGADVATSFDFTEDVIHGG